MARFTQISILCSRVLGELLRWDAPASFEVSILETLDGHDWVRSSAVRQP